MCAQLDLSHTIFVSKKIAFAAPKSRKKQKRYYYLLDIEKSSDPPIKR